MVGAIGPERAAATGQLSEILAEHHLTEAHFYLPFIGVAPEWQGRGYGKVVMQPVLDLCDHHRLPAYLESSNPRNIPFYERLAGFRVTAEFAADGGPPMAGMRRTLPTEETPWNLGSCGIEDRRHRLHRRGRTAWVHPCLARRLPDDLERRLRHPRRRRHPDQDHPSRHRRRRCGNSAGTGHGGVDRNDQRAGARTNIPRHRHGEHGDAHHGPPTDADQRVRPLPRRTRATAARRGSRGHLAGHHGAGASHHARRRLRPVRTDHPDVRLGLRPSITRFAAGAHGDGAVLSIPPQPEFVERVWSSIERGAAAVGRTVARDSSR
ncbi:MAG: GNAT family N-acetyltransferase [Acidimicrobiales bacterium]